MYKRLFIIIISFFLSIPNAAYAQTMNICASKAVVLDKKTNTVLYCKKEHEASSMASTTKIMTCIIAIEKADLKNLLSIDNEMLNGTEGSLIYLKAGDTITVRDLIVGSMLASGNDAANALAICVSGSIKAFSSLMNEYAKKLGMHDSHFETASGLDSDNHYSTAYDMALLTSYALNNEVFKSICMMQKADITISGKKHTVYNHNKLLYQVDECVGVKTGFTEKSGRCLISAFDYKGNTIIIVTLNDADDWNDHIKLYEYAKNRYETLSKSIEYRIDLVGGKKEYILCGCSFDISYLNDIEYRPYYYPFVYAPIIKNSKIGVLEIYSSNNLVRTVDIIVLESEELWQITK